jgi:branched-chain amino acid transport system substrate-binding protein
MGGACVSIKAMRAVCAGMALLLVAAGLRPSLSAAQASSPDLEIAAALGVTGDEATFGQGSLEGIQLAVEEANAANTGSRIKLVTYDDHSSDNEARAIAAQIVASPAIMVLGPDLSTASLAAGPVYAQAGLASLTTSATSDLITDNPTTFRIVFKNSDQGELLATYIARVLGQKSASVVSVDNGYGRSLLSGFNLTAERLGLQVQYFSFSKSEETDEVARKVAAAPSGVPVVLLTLDGDGARLLTTLRRLGVTGTILGDDSFGDESFSGRLTDTPEEQARRGALTDGVLGLSPMILDSADAEIQGFAARFRQRFGHDPVWFSTAGYDAARAAIETVRAVSTRVSGRDQLRAAALDHLKNVNSPATALPGLLGPLWFDEHHGRQQAIRIGRFVRSHFESAPLQIVPVTTPDAGELASGEVFELAPNRFARLQRIVYTGVYINEISRIDLARSSFGADFYIWLRFARDAGPNSTEPTDLTFPNLLSGNVALNHPSEQREMPDGTVYRLWRVQGEFRNDFDLHLYPFDRQDLSLSFFNTRAAADRVVYVIDRRRSDVAPSRAPLVVTATGGGGTAQAATPLATSETTQIASLAAFRNLTQWSPIRALAQRDNLVTNSALGDPGKAGVESYRELSGFRMTIEVSRRAIATLAKSLLPLGLMTLIMFASLFFPHGLVKEKVTVAITAALSGAVLLTSINSQLGGVGYTIAVEYVFYVFFGLCVVCILSVLSAERLRVAGRSAIATRTELWTRVTFVIVVAAIVAWGLTLASHPRA